MIIKNPLNSSRRVRMNKYDSDVIIENELSNTKMFRNVPDPSALTQNSWNMSRKTRTNVYNDVEVVSPRSLVEGRIARANQKLPSEQYGDW